METNFKTIREIREKFLSTFGDAKEFWLAEIYCPPRPGPLMSYKGMDKMSREEFIAWMEEVDWYFDATIAFDDSMMFLDDDEHIFGVSTNLKELHMIKRATFDYWKQTIIDSWSPDIDGEPTLDKIFQLVEDPLEWNYVEDKNGK